MGTGEKKAWAPGPYPHSNLACILGMDPLLQVLTPAPSLSLECPFPSS